MYWYFEGRAKRISWQIGCQLWDSLSPVSRDSKVQPWVISGWPRLSPGSASFYQQSCWEKKDLWFSYLLFWDQESGQLNQSKRYCTVSLTWRTMVKHSLPSKVSFRFAFFSKVHWFPFLERWSHQPTFIYLFFFLIFIYLAAESLSCGTWELVPWPGIKPSPPVSWAQSFSHWTNREFPSLLLGGKKVNPISWRLSYGTCYLKNTDVLIKWKDRQRVNLPMQRGYLHGCCGNSSSWLPDNIA